jgi:hypothetical protein
VASSVSISVSNKRKPIIFLFSLGEVYILLTAKLTETFSKYTTYANVFIETYNGIASNT